VQVNTEIVAIQRVITAAGEAQLKGLITDHAAKTGSKKAAALLADWANAKAKFWQIVPPGEWDLGVAAAGVGAVHWLSRC
jgi:glutamate synthase (ferredoxin)